MSKYIDAEKLKATLETRIANGLDGYGGNLKWLLKTIDSLQQYLPDVDLKKEIEKYFKGWTETDEGIACHYQYVDLNTCRSIARHFYEFGQCNARKEG